MQANESIFFVIFVIFSGAAVLSTLALFTRQSLLVAYILLGMLLGPSGLKLLGNSSVIAQTGDIGIIFLLFLLGLHLHPQNLWKSLSTVSPLTIISSLLFACVGGGITYAFDYSMVDSLVVAGAMMFSSTIIGLKLLPTTVLHHQHTGELMIGVLLMQDILAIAVLFIVQCVGVQSVSVKELMMVVLGLPLLLVIAFLAERFILSKLLHKFDRIQEYIFMLSIGWCLGMATIGHEMGLSHEIGAFIAGVALAANPISLYIAESLKPLRDFFLVIFFFTVGAGFNFSYLQGVLLPALMLTAFTLLVKPYTYSTLFQRLKESSKTSWELGWRLGQMSEFSLLVAYLASEYQIISQETLYLIEASTIMTFIVSCYLVVMKYPTPVTLSDTLRKD